MMNLPSEWEANHELPSGVAAAEDEQVNAGGCKQGIAEAKPVWAKFQTSGRIDRVWIAIDPCAAAVQDTVCTAVLLRTVYSLAHAPTSTVTGGSRNKR